MKLTVLTLNFLAAITVAGSAFAGNNCQATPNWIEVHNGSGWTSTSTIIESNGEQFYAFGLPRTNVRGIWAGARANNNVPLKSKGRWFFWDNNTSRWEIAYDSNMQQDGVYTWGVHYGWPIWDENYSLAQNAILYMYQADGYLCYSEEFNVGLM
ncbi:MAG: hypothetical protein JXR76_06305 [Deltaproteobacteria bacterium]|nr:hypothetical protein [Deltaproteobacteria bacterium]